MRYQFMRFPEGKMKAITLSYDDGFRTDIQLAEILNEYGFKATFNINSSSLSKTENDGRLTAEEIRNHLLSAGHEIAVHGEHHIAPGNVSAIVGIHDVFECRKSLENAFGGIIRGMAYPDSGINRISGNTSKEEIKNYLKMLGMKYARTLGGDNDRFEMPGDWYEWMPTAHHNNVKLTEYINKFLALESPIYFYGATPKLFYLWGHSFEFQNNNNWNIMKDFCKAAANHDDIWYATNGEICDYTMAYHALEFNVDNTLVYNPTLYEIWFCADGKTYSAKSGETLEIK